MDREGLIDLLNKKSIRFKLTEHKEAIKQADIIVFLVAHNEFKDLEIIEDKIILKHLTLITHIAEA